MSTVIRTARLILRPVRESDADELFAQFAHWEVMRWLSSPPWPYQREDAQSYLREQARPGIGVAQPTFAITLDDRLIGGIDVRQREPSHLQRGAGPNVGYWIGQSHWGRGYMTEAARGLIGHLFAAGFGDTIYCGAFAGNAASLKVQEKLGFVQDGTTMLYSRPRQAELPHVNTMLVRARFELMAA